VQNIRRSLVEYSNIMWETSDESLGPKKETICHRTASKTNPLVEITVSANALQTHLDHGDFIGKCGKRFSIPGIPGGIDGSHLS
jgi:hypothetical protein